MKRRSSFSVKYYLALFAAILLMETLFFSGPAVKEISYSRFRTLLAHDKIDQVVIQSEKIFGLLKSAKSPEKSQPSVNQQAPISVPRKKTPWHLDFSRFSQEAKDRLEREFIVVRLQDNHLLEDLQAHGVDYRGKIQSDWLGHLFTNWIIPIIVMFLIWGWFIRKMGQGPNALNIGKNKAKIYEVDPSQKVTFQDVAGVDEAVEEVKEVVAFLKEPERYTRLGAKLPKGILLVGPPGTGKTLLARAVAGEAGVSFFSMSGSDFVEMFVGLGAARVRDLFKDAKTKAPCIIFIDELDAVGKSRGQGQFAGGNDERENTLNQLLTEMDGFDPKAGIIIMGATNRPEILDPALLRPGRFDRQILVDRPDFKGRVAIFKVHTRGLILAGDVDLHKLAGETPGFAGAEIANVCNEAALLASRNGHDQVLQQDFQDAIERVIAGLEKKNKLINPHEREVVAYHESGHAIVGHFTQGADPVQKVSIVPRGVAALGYTMQTPLEDRFLMSRKELLGKIKGLLGGRAAEDLVFGEISTGAANDLEKVSKIARNMIVVYGMSPRVPNLSLVDSSRQSFLGQGPMVVNHSQKLEELVDNEVQEMIESCYQEAMQILSDHRDKLEKMASQLLQQEKIDQNDIIAILGPRPPQATTVPPQRQQEEQNGSKKDFRVSTPSAIA
jgi:cell division protease FtsH